MAIKKLRNKKKLPHSEGVALLRRIREIMAGEAFSAQERLDTITQILLKELKGDACSVYVLRPGNVLELAATSGLNQSAVGVTRLPLGQGVIGHVVVQKKSLSLSCIAQHPNFILHPETGEQHVQGGVVTVPLMRDNEALGALSIQSMRKKRFSADVLDALETIAMVITDLVGALALEKSLKNKKTSHLPGSRILQGIPIHTGLAQGFAVIHAPKVDVPLIKVEDAVREQGRLEQSLSSLNAHLEKLWDETQQQEVGDDQKNILETFQLFAKDRGWINKISKAIEAGYTAESAVQKSLDDMRTRLHASKDLYMRERLWDFEDLAHRLIQDLLGKGGAQDLEGLDGIIVVASSLGPAEFLEYQKYNLQAVLLEEGVQTAHVAILARSLNVPIIGRIPDVTNRIGALDKVLVDGQTGKAIIQPSGLDEHEFHDRQLKQNRLFETSKRALEFAPVTVDGVKISLNLNAGLITDLDHLKKTGVEGVGLYRTEIPFMMQKELPDVAYQTNLYSDLYGRVQGKPLVFRTLDIGGDKVLPYFNRLKEDNPMLGWRSIRIGLDRPMLLRKQVRAMIRAARGNTLHLMFPMVTEVSEFLEAKALVHKELAREESLGKVTPLEVKYGTMLEVPSLVWHLEHLLPHVDFLSIGTNDLFQFFFAIDRGNPYVAEHYDTLSPSFLSCLKFIKEKADNHHCPISICGEMASRPLEALALLGLGYETLSMGAAAVGASKRMIRSVNLKILKDFLETVMPLTIKTIRNPLIGFAKDNGIQI